jgi:RES domain
MVGISDVFPPVVQGWEAFVAFARATKSDLRYFRAAAGEQFIQRVLDSSTSRVAKMSKGTCLWRARLGATSECVVLGQTDDGRDICSEEDRPYPPNQMKPLQNNWKSEGRVNPRGICYIYLAKGRSTALAEVRPWMGSKVSVGKFELIRDVSLIDCSKYHNSTIMSLRDAAGTFEDGIWFALDKAFAKPVARDETSLTTFRLK